MSQTVALEVGKPSGLHDQAGKDRAHPPNLIVARGKRLELYNVRYVEPHQPGKQLEGARLEVVAQLPLYGVVQDMAVLSGRGNNGQRDSIILAFRDAKLSVVEWDASQHDVRSSSLHSFEGDAAASEGRKLFPRAPRVVTDPQGRCAAAVFYGHHLALLPAMELDVLELMLQDGTSAKVPSSAASVGNSYVINLFKSAGIRDVRDAVFLHGYTEPVLLVLHETEPTWPGRYRDAKDTCCLTALSLNLRRKRHPAIWSARNLPSDATALMAVPKGGALLLCQNLISYHTQGASCTLAINSNAFPGEVPPRLDPMAPEGEGAAAVRQARLFATNVHPEAAAAAGRTAPKAPGLELEGDAARGTWLAPNVALLGLKSGQLVLVQLRFEGNSATKIQISSAGGAPVASCACTLTDQLLFMGSWTGDSLLVRYSLERGATAAAGAAAAAGPAAKRRRLSRLSSIDMGDRSGEAPGADDRAVGGGRDGSSGDGAGVKEEDEEVFRAAMGRAASTVVPIVAGDAMRYSLKVMDSLICLGPVRDMAIAELALGITSAEPSQDPAAAASGGRLHSLVTAVGNDKTGALAVLKRGLVSDTITAVPLANVTGAWALHHRPHIAATAAGAGAAAAAAAAAPEAAAQTAAASSEANAGAVADSTSAGAGEGGSGGTAGAEPDGNGHGKDAAAPASAAGSEDDFHAFLLLSVGGASTMVLDARGDELQEISRTAGFVTDAPTLAAGNVLHASAAVQVTPGEVRLLEADRKLQHLPLNELVSNGDDYQGVQIRAGDVQDPFALLQLTNGQAMLLEADASSRTLQVVAAAAPALLEAPAADFNAHITAACLFRDSTGWLAAAIAHMDASTKAQRTATAATTADAGISLEDEEEEGADGPGDVEMDMAAAASGAGDASGADRGNTAADVTVKTEAPEPQAETPSSADGGGGAVDGASGSGRGDETNGGAGATVFCFVSRNDARLEVYRLPSMEVVFTEAELVIGHHVLSPSRPPSPLEDEDLELDLSPVVELGVESFSGASGSAGGVPALQRPVMLALMQDGTLLAYQAFQHTIQPTHIDQAQQPKQHTPHQVLAFKRLHIDWLSHEDAAPSAPATTHTPQSAAYSRLVRFEGLVAPAAGGATTAGSGALQYCGVFACGARPVWLVAARGGLLAHPMYQDAPVSAMTPFHNVNCPHGYILAGAGGLRICQLPAQVRLDTPWLSYKQPVRATPVRLSWYQEARLFAVLTSRLGTYRPYLPEEPDGDPHASASYAAADAAASAAGLDELCELRLIAPPGAAATPGAAAAAAAAAATPGTAAPGAPLWRYQLLPGEEPMCIKAVRLKDHGAAGGAGDEGQPFLAVGTSSDFGEDYLTMGRILLFQVTRQTQFRLEGGSEEVVTGRLEVWREYPGPVAAVDHLRGYLVVGVGHRLELHYRQGSSLIKAAFFDAPLMVTSISIVKDFILLGDVQQGTFFLRYTEANRQLELLGNDFDKADVWVADFLPNGAKLNMVVADGSHSLQVLVYDKNDPDSWKGRKLMKRGAMHVGSGVTRFQRLRMSVPNDTANRQALLYGTLDGGVGLLAPFWNPDMYKRLASLQYELTYRLRHTAGLNPRAFRSRYARVPKALGGGCSCSRPMTPAENQMLQGDLLWAFAGLDLRLQAAIAEGIGCTGQQILADLRSIAQATSFL